LATKNDKLRWHHSQILDFERRIWPSSRHTKWAIFDCKAIRFFDFLFFQRLPKIRARKGLVIFISPQKHKQKHAKSRWQHAVKFAKFGISKEGQFKKEIKTNVINLSEIQKLSFVFQKNL
jgi:hypothetical protein